MAQISDIPCGYQIRTDEDGRFELLLARDRGYRIHAVKPHHVRASEQIHSRDDELLRLTLKRHPRGRLRIVEGDGRTPISRAVVTILFPPSE